MFDQTHDDLTLSTFCHLDLCTFREFISVWKIDEVFLALPMQNKYNKLRSSARYGGNFLQCLGDCFRPNPVVSALHLRPLSASWPSFPQSSLIPPKVGSKMARMVNKSRRKSASSKSNGATKFTARQPCGNCS